MTVRRRADLLLVERGLFESRAKAQAAIAAGRVKADAAVIGKAAQEIPLTALLEAEPEHPFVSRGGMKLSAALDRFGFEPQGRICLDVGASTGGFTEVLLGRGAARVYAVDVGTGQLHPRLRGRPDVVVLERTDVRSLDRRLLPQPPGAIVIDVSFISLALVLPAALRFASQQAWLVALIKPQFEAGRRNLKKGVVRDEKVHLAVCHDVAAAVRALGWEVLDVIASPIAGGDGNREFLLGARRISPADASDGPR